MPHTKQCSSLIYSSLPWGNPSSPPGNSNNSNNPCIWTGLDCAQGVFPEVILLLLPDVWGGGRGKGGFLTPATECSFAGGGGWEAWDLYSP